MGVSYTVKSLTGKERKKARSTLFFARKADRAEHNFSKRENKREKKKRKISNVTCNGT